MGVIYLVRHGQASLFGRDYDKLTDLGIEQSAIVGRALAERGVQPDLLVRGNLERHRETAAAAIAAAGWDTEPGRVTVDERWAELDHIDIIKVLRPTYTSHAAMVDALIAEPDPGGAFRSVFDEALAGWLSDEGEYAESHLEFRARVDAAFDGLVRRLGPAQTAVVFSSGGPVASVVATSLGLDTAAWLNVTRLTVNASVSKLVTGVRGVSLVSFNDHAHVEAAGRLTYT